MILQKNEIDPMSQSNTTMAEINVTPLVDVMLVLLVISWLPHP